MCVSQAARAAGVARASMGARVAAQGAEAAEAGLARKSVQDQVSPHPTPYTHTRTRTLPSAHLSSHARSEVGCLWVSDAECGGV